MALSARAEVYRHHQLKRLFAPESVAIVGVSANTVGFGARTLASMEAARFGGRIYPVNAKYPELAGRACYPSIAALPESPDCVIVAVPQAAVEAVVAECVARRAGGIVIFSSGYRETAKPERIAAQQRLSEMARQSGVPIVGPNCIGVVNYGNGFLGSFMMPPDSQMIRPRAGAIGLVSQSGALGFALTQALEHGISFSHMLTCGNACDVDVADEIGFLADDPGCKVIACLFEGMAQPLRLIHAAERAHAAGKPVIIYKMATGEQGAAGALSHTGSMAGSNVAYESAFRRAGIIIVDDFEALIETAAFFAKAPRPTAEGVAVVGTSGGACIMSSDKAELHGVPLPQPAPATRAVLERIVPEFGSPNNPCDITAQVITDPESLRACVEALLSDEDYGALVVPEPYASDRTAGRLEVFSQAAQRHGKVVCTIWLSEWLEGPGTHAAESDAHVALFRSMDRCFATLARWHAHGRWLRAQPRRIERAVPAQAAEAARALLEAAGRASLTESEAKRVLAAYGVPVVEDVLVQTAEEAVAAADRMGYPVAVKVESPDILHKTEAGIIRLGLKGAADVAAAVDAVLANAHRVPGAPRVHGVLVQPMVPTGVEIMVGATVDPLFGPMVVVGLGGVLVELMKDSAAELAPVTHAEALAMLERLRGRALLDGFRGAAAVDRDRLADVICRLSELAADQQARVAEVDVNPLICRGERIIAVDGLIVQREGRARA